MKQIPVREKIPIYYLNDKLSTVQIAKKVGLSVGAIGSILKSRGVKLRSPKEGLKARYPNGQFGKDANRWNGGRQIVSGYIALYMPDHPRAGRAKRVFEHILVAEKKLGRPITKDEVVHHINGNRQDNRPENLEVCLRSEHVHRHFTSGKDIQALLAEIKRLKTILDDNGVLY